MEVVYNVTYKYKSKEILTKDEIKEIFKKLDKKFKVREILKTEFANTDIELYVCNWD